MRDRIALLLLAVIAGAGLAARQQPQEDFASLARASLARIDGTIAVSGLRDTVEVSDSLLSKHITILEGAGYIEVVKGYEGKRPRTWFSLTAEGRAAFKRYKETLGRLIDGG